MAWHIVEKLLEQVAEHSTLVGKFWVTFFFVLRFLMVVSIADNVFEDEQEEFVCNTLTPGCENVCFNDFSPISLIRLWALQILFVALPTLIFMVYTAHKLTKIAQAKKLRDKKLKKTQKEANKLIKAKLPDYVEAVDENKDEAEKKKEKEKDGKKSEEDDDKVVATKLDSDTPSRLLLAYVAQVLFRLFVEIFFTIAHFHIYVYKMWIPELFVCSRWPCPNSVHCFVSRPKEKTVILWVMFGTSVVMIFLNAVELYHLGLSKLWEAWKTRNQDITKQFKLKNNVPTFGGYGGGRYGARYPRGYPQAVGIRVGYARSSISGNGNDFDGDQFI